MQSQKSAVEIGGYGGCAITEGQLNQTVFKNKGPVKSQGHWSMLLNQGHLKTFWCQKFFEWKQNHPVLVLHFVQRMSYCSANDVKGTFQFPDSFSWSCCKIGRLHFRELYEI